MIIFFNTQRPVGRGLGVKEIGYVLSGTSLQSQQYFSIFFLCDNLEAIRINTAIYCQPADIHSSFFLYPIHRNNRWVCFLLDSIGFLPIYTDVRQHYYLDVFVTGCMLVVLSTQRMFVNPPSLRTIF